MTSSQIYVRVVEPEEANQIHQLLAQHSAGELADNPDCQLCQTPEILQGKLAEGYGLAAVAGSEIVGFVFLDLPEMADLDFESRIGELSKICVFASDHQSDVTVELVNAAVGLASRAGAKQLQAKTDSSAFDWAAIGFEPATDSAGLVSRALPTVVVAETADQMRAIGARLAKLLKAGDLIIASGELGSGKTTLTQGIGSGLDVSGPVISPTFVLSRVHKSNCGGPMLVHVDAYRLSSAAELADIDLDVTLEDAVTLVEWGTGIAESLTEDRLEIDILRSLDPAENTREIFFTGIGKRWAEVDFSKLAD